MNNKSKIHIRQELAEDHSTVFNLITSAFQNEVMSDHREQFLVERLRQSEAFIPALSLVAVLENQIVGYTLLTKLKIINGDQQYGSLALAPVAVLPEFQGRGIGGQLIRTAHESARRLGYESVILLGHAGYYPRFGYRPASNYNITLPFEVPDENCMAIELVESGLKGVRGIVQYPTEFFEN